MYHVQNLGDMLNQALRDASKAAKLKKELKEARNVIQQQAHILAAKQQELEAVKQQVLFSLCACIVRIALAAA